jgi:hypothetical protein
MLSGVVDTDGSEDLVVSKYTADGRGRETDETQRLVNRVHCGILPRKGIVNYQMVSAPTSTRTSGDVCLAKACKPNKGLGLPVGFIHLVVLHSPAFSLFLLLYSLLVQAA